MKLSLKIRESEALAEYYPEEKRFVVKGGSHVSNDLSQSKTFRSIRTIEKLRREFVVDGVVQCDVVFGSASSAANFVTGRSANGLTVWKDENGIQLKDLL